MRKILFLDDAGWRHSEFTRRTDRAPDLKVWQAHHAEGAVALLESETFDQVFLDHDLSEEDTLIEVGKQSFVPTGMAVVEFIMKMENPPMDIVVHSCNEPAALEMVRRLIDHPAKIRVRRLAFPDLMSAMDRSPAL